MASSCRQSQENHVRARLKQRVRARPTSTMAAKHGFHRISALQWARAGGVAPWRSRDGGAVAVGRRLEVANLLTKGKGG
eukprot:5994879-Pleurochrysis_carterae.AAC.1